MITSVTHQQGQLRKTRLRLPTRKPKYELRPVKMISLYLKETTQAQISLTHPAGFTFRSFSEGMRVAPDGIS